MISRRDTIKRLLRERIAKATGGGTTGNVQIEGFYIEMTNTGMRIREVRTVTGLRNGRPEDAIFIEGIPRPDLGSTHHRLHWLPCTRTYAEMLGDGNVTKAKVTSEFEVTDDNAGGTIITDPEEVLPELEFSSTLQMEQTNQHYVGDDNGNLVDIILEDDVIVEDPDSQTSHSEHVGPISPIVEFPIAMTEFIYRRQESSRRRVGSQNLTVGDISILYTGTVNDREIFGGHPKYSWMCTAIIGASSDGGQTYHMAYQFQHHPTIHSRMNHSGGTEVVGGWCQLVGIPDDNGYPRAGLTLGDGTASHPGGKAFVRLAKSANFDDLQLTI